MSPCLKIDDIDLERWCQSNTIALRNTPEEDLDDCNCEKQKQSTREIVVVDDNMPDQSETWIQNPLYTLASDDRKSIKRPDGWLTDAVI